MVINMKYNIGDKFLIEIDSEYCKYDTLGGFKTNQSLYRIKGYNSLVFDEYGLDKLEKYQEQNTNETYNKAYNDGYDNGLKDFLDVVYRIVAPDTAGGLSEKTLRTLFSGTCGFPSKILNHYSAKDIIKIIKDYEQEIRIGDEVTAYNYNIIVTELHDNNISGIDLYGNIFTYTPDQCVKTGKHYDKFISLLKELQNDESTNSTKK